MPADTKVQTPIEPHIAAMANDLEYIAREGAEQSGSLFTQNTTIRAAAQLRKYALELTARTAEVEEARKRVKWLEDRVASMAQDMYEMSQEEK